MHCVPLALCQVVVCLGSRDPSLPDPTGLTLGRPHTQDDWIGLTVCQSEVDREGRVWEVAEQQVVQEVPAAGSRQASADASPAAVLIVARFTLACTVFSY